MIKYAYMHTNATSQGTKAASGQVVNTARGYPSLLSDKRIGVILLLPGCNDTCVTTISPLRGYPQH